MSLVIIQNNSDNHAVVNSEDIILVAIGSTWRHQLNKYLKNILM